MEHVEVQPTGVFKSPSLSVGEHHINNMSTDQEVSMMSITNIDVDPFNLGTLHQYHYPGANPIV